MLNRNVVFGTAGSSVVAGGDGADTVYGYDPGVPSAITATRVASGLSQPVYVTAPPGDPDRLFIVEKGGLIRILDLGSGQVLATPFLNVAAEIDTFNEQGLLGLAFDPSYASNGRFFVYLSVPGRDAEIRSYRVSADPDVADPASMGRVIQLDYPATTGNHRAGWIGFGPDGYLYANTGEGAVVTNAPDTSSLLGKILRLDVNYDSFPADPNLTYAIPAGNPFASGPGADEIYAYGLRNPWRASFDRLTGDFYVGDVGNGAFEEVDLGRAGADYGWYFTEGAFDSVAFPSFDQPIFSYPHGSGLLQGNSITGGYVLRGPEEGLNGLYLFGDFVSGRLFSLQLKDGAWTAVDRTASVTTSAGTINNIASFGEDGAGHVHLVDIDGEVYRITPPATLADGADTLIGGDGGDILYGGGGNDVVFGEGGEDTLVGGAGQDQLFGGGGVDTVPYESTGQALYVDLRGMVALIGGALADSFNSVENVVSGSGDDLLVGDEGANALDGGAGLDQLFGMGGDDNLAGGAAPDGQYNQLFGGAGADTASYAGRAGSLYLDLVATGGFQKVSGGYVLVDAYNSIENLRGGEGNDVIAGDAGANALAGGRGYDVLYGRGGADTFVFASAADSDLVSGYDTIADFTTGEDRIDLRALGLQPGQVVISSAGGSTAVSADLDPTLPGYELAIAVSGVDAVALADVIF